jgi:hypothetical protein
MLNGSSPSRLALLATWLALPVYAWQGLGVRRRTSRLLPAAGPVTGAIDGAEPNVVLLERDEICRSRRIPKSAMI